MAFRLSDIKNVVEGNKNYYLSTSLSPETIAQIEKRMEACQPCVAAGKCIICRCKTPEMFYTLSKSCPNGKWGPIIE